MCIAIANLKDKPLSDQELTNCWENNNHGAGILYVENGKLKAYKQIKSLHKFKKKYNKVIKESNCVIHFRISTAGGINVKNCHPFIVNEDVGFAHNGVIQGWGTKVKEQSDTYSYNQLVLQQLPKNFLSYPAITNLIKEDIGSYNKFVFMDKDQNFTIINQEKGHFGTEGNWYSNDSYKRTNDYVWAGNKKVYKKPGKKTCGLTNTKTTTKITTAGTHLYGFDLRVHEGKIILQKDGTYKTDTGLRIVRNWSLKPDDTYVWKQAYSGYVAPELMEEEEEEKAPIEFSRSEIEHLDDNQFDDTAFTEDEQWLKEQLEANDYITELCMLFDQVPGKAIEEITDWNQINRLGAIMVKYTDLDSVAQVEMSLNAAVRLVLNAYEKTELTFGHAVSDYIKANL